MLVTARIQAAKAELDAASATPCVNCGHSFSRHLGNDRHPSKCWWPVYVSEEPACRCKAFVDPAEVLEVVQ